MLAQERRPNLRNYKEVNMQKSMTYIIQSIILISTLSSSAMAQPKFGATYGIVSSNFSVDPDSGVSLDSNLGITIGGVFVYPINDNLDLRSGLSFTQKGSKIDTEFFGITAKSTTDLSYLTIPLLAQYKLNSSGNTLYGLGGLDIGILMSANIDAQIRGELFGVNFDSDTSYSVKDDLKSTDIALNIGGGYMIEKGYSKLYVEILYSLGLLDIDAVSDNSAIKTKSLILGIGYIF